jgi:nitroreductase
MSASKKPPRQTTSTRAKATPKARAEPVSKASASGAAAQREAQTFGKPGRHREPAPPAIDVEEFRKVVKSRRSVRRFTGKAIPAAVLDDCLDLALLAPNSSNLQPWGFYVVKTPALRARLITACMNQNAAKTAAELIVVVARTGTFLENARLNLEHWPMPAPAPKLWRDYYQKLVPLYYTQGPLGSFGFVRKNLIRLAGPFRPVPRGPFNQADLRVWAVKSAALACENLMLALRAHGFDSCPMEGFDAQRVSRLLKLPTDAEIVMVIGAGERADDGVYYPQIRFARERFVKQV